MIVTDLGFLAYWTVTALRLLPDEVLFADHHDPRVIAWNWSFLPLDLLVSATGIAAVALRRCGSRAWHPLMLVSLTLTATAGLMALAYWALRGEFDITWWAPNLFLLLYPVPALAWLMICPTAGARPPRSPEP
ncbi:YvaD family protein [Pseudonocardia sp. DSM 110487]|uniref:DUF5360 family protein n=1 Tax=Pseudonocardia sp. DSM 110487 TaxID=2865833 RepID=UPI001C6A8450|nr:DUF5360 family protein [Pseudonocardia sp. DSM 110487]QYN39823.1 YvaD family protein [Pseudonocardia sp. DSM 110487]